MIFIVLIALVAFLYSSVGHAGASGYIAAVLVAGTRGSGLSAWKLPAPAIRVLLSAALLVAPAKFLLSS